MSSQAEWDWGKSEEAFKQFIESNPSHALAHAHYGHILMFQKQFDEAIKMGQKAISLDPKNDAIQSLFLIILWHSGNVEEAMEIAVELKDEVLLNLVSESSSFLQGDLKRSFEFTSKLFERDSMFSKVVKKVYEQDGYQSAMAEWSRILENRFDVEQLNIFRIALYLNRAGKYNDAIKWLEKGAKMHDVNMAYALVFEEFANLRSDPRFVIIAEKIGLPL